MPSHLLGRHLRGALVHLAGMLMSLAKDSSLVDATLLSTLQDAAWEVRHEIVDLIPCIFEMERDPRKRYAALRKALPSLGDGTGMLPMALVRTHVSMYAKIMELAEEHSHEVNEADAAFMLCR
jgi:hypothetical protein